MADKKIYTAFISSAFESLRDERQVVIDTLLGYRILPIGMEHFTVSSSGNFSDIEELIDDSDFFIMLLGSEYGSTDEKGISWTEREYRYAMLKKKRTVVIICDELIKTMSMPVCELTESQRKQIEFAEGISFACKVSDGFDIKTFLNNFFNPSVFSKCTGWTRIEDVAQDSEALEKWREENVAFDLAGTWYHVHLSEEDENYIRFGTVTISQDFTPGNFRHLVIHGENFSVLYYDKEQECFYENEMRHSHFEGEYSLKESGIIFGIFNSKRSFKEDFGSKDVSTGTHRGIHDFTFDVKPEKTKRISGDFHDEAPSPKLGKIFIFRDINARDKFLLMHRGEKIKQI